MMSKADRLRGIIKSYLFNHNDPDSVTKFLIRDWILETKRVDCSEDELEEAIRLTEEELGVKFEEGSLAESIQGIDRKYIRFPDEELIKMESPSRYIN